MYKLEALNIISGLSVLYITYSSRGPVKNSTEHVHVLYCPRQAPIPAYAYRVYVKV